MTLNKGMEIFDSVEPVKQVRVREIHRWDSRKLRMRCLVVVFCSFLAFEIFVHPNDLHIRLPFGLPK